MRKLKSTRACGWAENFVAFDSASAEYRAQLAVHADERVLLRSRQGTDMTASFPESRAAALAQLPSDTGLDGVM
ncbi:hypothetical protein [Streptomyces sp. NPDC055287]